MRDEIVNPSLALNIYHSIGMTSFSMTGQVGYDFYAHNTILNRQDVNVLGGVGSQLGSCQLGLQSNYTTSQSNLAELALGTTQNTLETLSPSFKGLCNKFRKTCTFIFRYTKLDQ